MRYILALVITLASALAQTGDVTISQGPPRQPFALVFDVDASGNVVYAGKAQTPQAEYRYQRATCTIPACQTFTSIVVASNVGTLTGFTNHGLTEGNQVCITGATVDTDLNACYLITSVADANTATITTASVTGATYNESTLVVTTRAARTTAPIWSIQKFLYDRSTLGPEALNETNFATHTKWDVTGDFSDSGGNATYTHATGTGTLTQTTANLAVAMRALSWYKFTYAVSSYSGDPACTLSGFSNSSQTLRGVNGTHTLYFISAPAAANFVITCTSGSGAVTFDDLTLKPLENGDDVVNILNSQPNSTWSSRSTTVFR